MGEKKKKKISNLGPHRIADKNYLIEKVLGDFPPDWSVKTCFLHGGLFPPRMISPGVYRVGGKPDDLIFLEVYEEKKN